MRVNSEAEMLKFGQSFAEQLEFPAIIELVGDVGAGKTTFTRGLALGLGITEPVTSPSFTISKRYPFLLPGNTTSINHPPLDKCCKNYNEKSEIPSHGELIHYDFYRLGDPGIMRDELFDALNSSNAVIVVEWGGGVSDLLPESKYRLEISQIDTDVRKLKLTHNSEDITDLWKNCGELPKTCAKPVDNLRKSCGKNVNKSEKSCSKSVDNSDKSCGKTVKNFESFPNSASSQPALGDEK